MNPELNELDMRRAALAIERIMPPSFDIPPEYSEFAVRSMGRFITASRGAVFNNEGKSAGQEEHDMLYACFAATQEELGITPEGTTIEYLFTDYSRIKRNLACMAGVLLAEAQLLADEDLI